MRRIILYTLLLLFTNTAALFSQSLPFTGGVPCTNCVPTGWSVESGTPDLSNAIGQGGNSQFPWSHIVTPPPSNYVLASFLSINNSISKKDVVSTKITGLVSGAKYEIKYHVMSSASQATQGKYGKTAILKLSTGGQFPVQIATQTTSFTDELNTELWISKTLTFIAVADYADLQFSGTASDVGGFVFLDIAGNAITAICNSGTQQVSLSTDLLIIDCPSQTEYLPSAYSDASVPAGSSIVWYSNATHTGNPVVGDVGPGTYYAFYNDQGDNSCYNTNQSTSKVTVISQIPLTASSATISCGQQNINLNNYIKNFQPESGEIIQWFSNATHTGQPVTDPTYVFAGNYYAFVKDPVGNCFNTNLSTAHIEVTSEICPCNAGNSQLTTMPTMSNVCPAGNVNLNNGLINYMPILGTSVKWFSTANHAPGTEVLNASLAGSGTFYAFVYDAANNCFNTNNSTAKIIVSIKSCGPCKTGTDQVWLSSFTQNCESYIPANLDFITLGAIPAGAEVVWFDNPTHSGQKIANPTDVGYGTYYAFYYDPANDCYNTNNSTAVTVLNPPPAVPLSANNVAPVCPSNTVNLNALFVGNIPQNAYLQWFTNDSHNGQKIADPTNALPGTYYAFFKFALMGENDVTGCYNYDKSTAVVTVNAVNCIPCNAGTSQVNVNPTLANICPVATVNLNDALVNPIFNNLAPLKWFTSANHMLGTEVANPNSAGQGVYYVFKYDPLNNCYNTDFSTAKVTVTINSCPACQAGTDQVNVAPTLTNVCPVTTVNLNDALINPVFENFVSFKWFTTATHTPGTEVMNVATAGAGTYYAFKHDFFANCFNTNLSTAKVTITTSPCNTAVELKLKVFLQGACTQDLGVTFMRNDLQKFGGTGLLPTIDPYGGGVSYPDINSPLSEIEIVDWVKVEIRSADDPSIIFESKSLLLRKDGSVLNIDGTDPKFNSQPEAVQIVVKHRNHLAVMSNPIAVFTGGSVNYDFTTDLSKAYNVGAPIQMVSANGVWCMVLGDVQQDLVVDNADYAFVEHSYKIGESNIYSPQDLNLDGLVNDLDFMFFVTSFNGGFFSTLINY